MRLLLRRWLRAWALLRLYWDTSDYDWTTIALLMRHQISRTREHIQAHDFTTDTERMARQMRIAETLLTRMLDEPYYEIAEVRYPARGKPWADMAGELTKQDSDLLARVLSKHLRSWWD
jgi:hypothetical protein